MIRTLPDRTRKGRRIIENAISQQLAGSLSGLDGLIVAGAVLLLFVISYIFGRQEKDTEDFFLGGRRVPPGRRVSVVRRHGDQRPDHRRHAAHGLHRELAVDSVPDRPGSRPVDRGISLHPGVLQVPLHEHLRVPGPSLRPGHAVHRLDLLPGHASARLRRAALRDLHGGRHDPGLAAGRDDRPVHRRQHPLHRLRRHQGRGLGRRVSGHLLRRRPACWWSVYLLRHIDGGVASALQTAQRGRPAQHVQLPPGPATTPARSGRASPAASSPAWSPSAPTRRWCSGS